MGLQRARHDLETKQQQQCICFNAALCSAKSLQSCPTLCDPIDGSPPGSPIPGILQAGTLEWVAISFSNAWKWKVKGKLLSRVHCSPNLFPSSKLRYIYAMEHYSAIKRTHLSVPMRWMNLEPIVQSEVNQKEKNKYCILTYLYGIWKDGTDEPICKVAMKTQT